MSRVLQVQTSPHVIAGTSVRSIMVQVALAALPAAAFAVYAFGLAALLGLVTAIAACLAMEHVTCRWRGTPSTIGDGSALVTGLLYGMTLPPSLPLWMVVVGGVVSIGLGKALFGGLGYNTFNPALVGRAFLQAAFPASMTTWLDAFGPERFTHVPSELLTAPLSRPVVDATSAATPLAAFKYEHVLSSSGDLFFGSSAGSSGETCSLLILAGAAWLVARRLMNWRISAAVLGTVGLAASLLHACAPDRFPPADFMLASGGLMLGATFMATDTVGSPMTNPGCVIYGVFIGVLVVVIRLWGGMPEGVMYAILLGNAATPHIDRCVRPRVFGTWRRARREAGA